MNYGFAFFDGRGPLGDTNQMTSRSWIAFDVVHATQAGYSAYDSVLSYWLGLDAFVRGNNVSGSFTGDGSGLTNLSANAISGGLTANISVLGPGGSTNTLLFTNGILRAVR